MIDWKNHACKLYSYSKTSFVILFQMPLNSSTRRSHLVFNHGFDQLLAWFVYVYDPPLLFQQTPKFVREHVPIEVKALRCRECLGDGLRELGGVGSRKHDLDNGRRADDSNFSKSNNAYFHDKTSLSGGHHSCDSEAHRCMRICYI
jgi:hypothetical protein